MIFRGVSLKTASMQTKLTKLLPSKSLTKNAFPFHLWDNWASFSQHNEKKKTECFCLQTLFSITWTWWLCRSPRITIFINYKNNNNNIKTLSTAGHFFQFKRLLEKTTHGPDKLNVCFHGWNIRTMARNLLKKKKFQYMATHVRWNKKHYKQ